ncbi:Pet127-domain-containing protein [Lojkania enalia]|uniref:Pet127-domain-containing protein n=1 Tax=Lojkania enalia TaxID=147567 RepID=A0A9P4MX92_9PLEO|nr:Pet127-domain-containing protein [Didymosphaeria enalia]
MSAHQRRKSQRQKEEENLPIEILMPEDLDFQPVHVDIPPVPRLAHGLDRVLFNPGVYRLQDPRSRIYNFDPYLEKIMPVHEFDFDALSEYKTSSKDIDLLDIARREDTKFTGSTSSMSGVLCHFHFLLSNWRDLNHDVLSQKFPFPSEKFSKIQMAPSGIFLRYKDGVYAIDADKSHDTPNIMSWLGNSLEKLLTNSPDEFERYRRSSPEKAPSEDESGKCFHYSKLGNFLIRSQLDAHDPRLPGTGIFDLKTRAVVSIRMNAQEYEEGTGYQLRYDLGQWESFEREFYDMTRATMLKYSLQVRMGRMDGIFVAFHNIERIFGFQYVSLPDMDNVLHGQTDTSLGDQEFKLSVRLFDEILQRAIEKFPRTSIRLHFETRNLKVPYMNIFAEPVTEEEADTIQNSNLGAKLEFERNTINVNRNDPELQAEWRDIQKQVNKEISEDDGRIDVTEEDEHTSFTGGDKSQGAQEAQNNNTSADGTPPKKKKFKRTSDSPLAGWVLTIRNRVNGTYVRRPAQFTSSDAWTLEYYIREIAEGKDKTIYEQLRERQRQLLERSEEEMSKDLKVYRNLLKRFSSSGRQWREEQDRIDARLGKRVYRPQGPGAEHVTSHAEAWYERPADENIESKKSQAQLAL